jgi:beta-RFAP synthase
VTDQQTVFVETSARLHFGVLDLRGDLGRWFGGIGAAAPDPTVIVSVSPAETLEAQGEDAARALSYGRRFLEHFHSRRGALIHVHRALPSHAGLGSGTQLALAVGRALAELYGVSINAPDLSRAVGRARRSAIGTWTFAHGGLVVEGGRHREGDACGPLLARLPFPPAWRCVLAVPNAQSGVSGAREDDAFATLPSAPRQEVEHVAHLVLMALLPAIAEADLSSFGAALTEIQEINGRWFASIQGGTFASGPSQDLVRRMREWGATGVGQSSWGPAVYAIVEGDDAARALADRVREALDGAGRVYEGPFRAEGARVSRRPIT